MVLLVPTMVLLWLAMPMPCAGPGSKGSSKGDRICGFARCGCPGPCNAACVRGRFRDVVMRHAMEDQVARNEPSGIVKTRTKSRVA